MVVVVVCSIYGTVEVLVLLCSVCLLLFPAVSLQLLVVVLDDVFLFGCFRKDSGFQVDALR